MAQAEWMFPNAIAMHAKRTAELKGQHANRIEIRDFDDKYPPFIRVSPYERCETITAIGSKHAPIPPDSFCQWCGHLVETR